MKSTLQIAENGTILSFSVCGVSILTPHHDSEDRKNARGGLPLCVPMFSTQQRPVVGSNLPLHGVLMYEPHGKPITLTEGQRWEKKFSFEPTENFTWKWNLKLEVVLEEQTLTYTLTIARDSACSNQNDMPYSLGFHPYFNTFGDDFSYQIGGHTTHKGEVPKDIADSAFAPLIQGESATLTTSKGKLTITPEGYDEYCLWTDDINSYFCIEPIFQYREYGLLGTLLKIGESHKTSVRLHFEPRS